MIFDWLIRILGFRETYCTQCEHPRDCHLSITESGHLFKCTVNVPKQMNGVWRYGKCYCELGYEEVDLNNEPPS